MDKNELKQLQEETFAKCATIMAQKNSDYTGGEGAQDAFANFRASEVIGIHPAMGILMRVMDKIQRVRSFVNDGQLKVTGETVDDACEDIVNYAVLLKGILQEERDNNENNS